MTNNVKSKVIDAVQKLPDDATYDDAIEQILFLAKVEEGLTQADAGRTSSHDDVKKRLLG